MTSLSERLNGLEIDWPKLDRLEFAWPKLDGANFDLPNFDLPNFDLPDFDLPELQLPTQSALQETLQTWTASALERLGQLDDAIAAQAQALLGQPIQQWFQTRLLALWPWILQHPLVAVLLIILGLVVLLNILQWLLNPKTWLAILSFPVRLIARWITPKPKKTSPQVEPVPTSTALTQPTSAVQTIDSRPEAVDQQEQVQKILARLKVLQTEQQQLHQQLESLLDSQSAHLP